MTENEISKIVLDAAIKVHQELGPGLLETVYETVLEYELKVRGLKVERQVPIPVTYEGIRMEDGFRIDLLVEAKVVIEIKAIEGIPPVVPRTVVTYLRFSGCKLGLLINFNNDRLIDGYQRIVLGL